MTILVSVLGIWLAIELAFLLVALLLLCLRK